MSLIEKHEYLDDGKFILKSKDPQQEGLAFLCEGITKEDSAEWISNIRAILDTQLDFLRALQSPIAYQKELTKEISAPELCSLWNPSLRKTLSHPSAVHKKTKDYKSKPSASTLGNTNTSKSVRISNKLKESKEKNKSPSPSALEQTSASESSSRKNSGAVASTLTSDITDRNLTSPSKLSKRSFIGGFKTSFKLKRNDFLVDMQASSSSFSNSSHSFDAATIKKSSLTNDYLTKVNTSIRRWSESAPRNTKTE